MPAADRGRGRARCPYCSSVRPVDDHGRLKAHSVTIRVSRSAVRTVGAGIVRRPCSGTGKPPQ